jgi:formylglycine-generating enzyme required for sulfatase activity
VGPAGGTPASDARAAAPDGAATVDAAAAPTPDAASDAAAALPPDAAVSPTCRQTVRVGGYEIFTYEASRPDATQASAGADETEVCSRAGVLPWTLLTHAEATAACASAGFALCTNEQWQVACAGPDMELFPYGGPHADAVCNDHIAGGNALEPTGARPGCRTASGIYDLSGNVWEITAESDRRGASWRLNASTYQQEYAGCFEHVFINDAYADDDVGFRCCRGVE